MSLDLIKLKEYRKQFIVEDKEPIFKYGDIVRIKSDNGKGLHYIVTKIQLIVSNSGYVYDLVIADGATFFGYEADLEYVYDLPDIAHKQGTNNE